MIDLMKVAHAVSEGIGYDYNDLYANKTEWINDRGAKGDINMPRKPDMDEAARAATREVLSQEPSAAAEAAGYGAFLLAKEGVGFAAAVKHYRRAVAKHIMENEL